MNEEAVCTVLFEPLFERRTEGLNLLDDPRRKKSQD
jgi:hypothetical protein